MPPRNPELPEGTDHIINGAMETSGDTGVGGTGSGFVGSAGIDDTGGTSAGLSSGGTGAATGASGGGDFGSISSGTGTSGGGADIKAQLRDGVSSVQQQAGEKVRTYALQGKSKATSALDDLTQVVNDAATSIDERLGSEYGEYARRAADAVAGFADTLRNKEVDELFDDGRNLVRKSPGVAIGVAAVVGFTLVRLLKSGMDTQSSGGQRDVDFTPDANLGSTGTTTTTTSSAAGTTTTTGMGA